jgi:hypothetical protein
MAADPRFGRSPPPAAPPRPAHPSGLAGHRVRPRASGTTVRFSNFRTTRQPGQGSYVTGLLDDSTMSYGVATIEAVARKVHHDLLP